MRYGFWSSSIHSEITGALDKCVHSLSGIWMTMTVTICMYRPAIHIVLDFVSSVCVSSVTFVRIQQCVRYMRTISFPLRAESESPLYGRIFIAFLLFFCRVRSYRTAGAKIIDLNRFRQFRYCLQHLQYTYRATASIHRERHSSALNSHAWKILRVASMTMIHSTLRPLDTIRCRMAILNLWVIRINQ